MEEFINHQINLVEKEKQVDVEDTLKMLSSFTPVQLQKRGVALIGLKVTGMRTGLGGKSLIDLELGNPSKVPPTFPPHKISTGDIVGLDEYKKDKQTKNKLGSQYSGVVLRATDTKITVALGYDVELPPEVQERCMIVKLANNVTYDRMLNALEQLKATAAAPDGLKQVLLGQRTPTAPQDISTISFFDETLNDSQKDAVRFALGANEIALVHGPPGTGKTYTLVEIIRQLAVIQKKKVLVCGPSNISVDNLVERLAKHNMNLVRVGHPARILPTVLDHSLDVITRTCDSGQIVADVRREMDETLAKISKCKRRAERRELYALLKDLRKDYRARERKVLDEIMTGAEVLISTLNGCGSKNMLKREFDVVIIDEATQALEAECWIALLKGKKAILAGDHLQLPPTVKTPTSLTKKKKKGMSTENDLSTTLFDRLLSMYKMDAIKRMLVVQYRMHQKIMEFSSKELYNNQLVADASVAEHILADMPDVSASENTEVPVVMIDTSDTGLGHEIVDDAQDNGEQSRANELEVDLAVRHIQSLLDDGLSEEHIGVITPYAFQVTHLIRAIREKWPAIEIGTVDGFQGREKEAIILSLVRSNDEGVVGFLAEKRRLNVAMTRPKRHLCVVCDSETLSGTKAKASRLDGGFLRRWMEWLGDESDLRFSEQCV
ncbi:P-loop containing nucleoside triphosphate hydrolase protein [Zychaea mexicana]|uniref:P-loop containing nucleoside triphosphate hydrolase protein n=1 Tax=Zychaea mexicana TaxID=64656 RepID=UPI0022FDC9B4|nr:P-loop containing nucleoside triphosphate hydrolase protein [Zychaea mexicana]KAI9493302.1 P-loop containing nucleoside triphosphate hydrolase protein [Zychaea mexicana]